MRRKFIYIIDKVDRLVIRSYGYDFIVRFSSIDHPHHTDDLSFNQRHPRNIYWGDDQDIQGIIVVTKRSRYKTVICRIVDCGKQYAIQHQHPRLFVQFIFTLTSFWNLDYTSYKLRRIIPYFHIMPWIDHIKN